MISRGGVDKLLHYRWVKWEVLRWTSGAPGETWGPRTNDSSGLGQAVGCV